FRDLQLRCPREYLGLEPRIQTELQRSVHRGRVDVFVRRTVRGAATAVRADIELARTYVQQIGALVAALGMQEEVPLAFVLQQPGVLEAGDAAVDVDAEWSVVSSALSDAVAGLLAMREAEGAVLAGVLGGFLDEVDTQVLEVEQVADDVAERLRERLTVRLQRLTTEGVDPQRLAQEVAVLADKADVAEEVARLRSHCEQFRTALQTESPIGRRLDFLLQEMNREVNTVGSKAADHPVSSGVVRLKSVLERMREQSANVE
nr:YicC family protein [Myxococcales bacterium]